MGKCFIRFFQRHFGLKLEVHQDFVELRGWNFGYVTLGLLMIFSMIGIGAVVRLGPMVLLVLLLPFFESVRFRVDSSTSWGEYAFFGVVYRRFELGYRPRISAGLVWDWSEVSVTPSTEELQRHLHDNERFVLCEYTSDEDRFDELTQAVALQIERLHPVCW